MLTEGEGKKSRDSSTSCVQCQCNCCELACFCLFWCNLGLLSQQSCHSHLRDPELELVVKHGRGQWSCVDINTGFRYIKANRCRGFMLSECIWACQLRTGDCSLRVELSSTVCQVQSPLPIRACLISAACFHILSPSPRTAPEESRRPL